MTGGAAGLSLARQDGVATIFLDHPERANALDPAEFHALAELFTALAWEGGLRAIVLTGRGERAFCAGLNLANDAAIRQDLSSSGPTGLGAALRAAARVGVPILGRINGACVAGGMGLLGSCDYAIASTGARFGLPEITHGIYPGVAMAGLWRRGAPGVVRRLADTGALIDADAALDAGLVEEICPPMELDDRIAAALSGRVRKSFQVRMQLDPIGVDRRMAQAEARTRLQ
ncbi:enoyl-CoA hydratase/isomerase family protein [Devosia sp.]|uniref:enoyl-CoA hydratase/isomerase family protein n=1 Tax=Devosia sp. TaxID=1871048 RepID=UPI002AFE6557|nr:enoyl-CoA hydratase/isomerase family protein [Devosia sp.]